MLNLYLFAAGLSGLVNTLRTGWVGPAFLFVIGIVAFKFLFNRQWMQFAGFAGMAALVAIFIFAPDSFFGESGSLTNVAKDTAKQVNTVDVTNFVTQPIFTPLN